MNERSPRLSVVPPPRADDQGEPFGARTDDELMLLARGGAEGAFDTLVRRHQSRLLRVAGRQLGRNAFAADAVQNTFVEIFRSLHRYQPRGRFPAYLYRILLNQCRMAYRHSQVELRALDAQAAHTEAPSAECEEEGRILARERHRDVEAALADLSQRLRDVVLLRYSAGLRYDEIAETLDVPLGTVKRRLFDATARLRRLLGAP